MRHCPCAHKQKRRHFHTKTTSSKLYIHIGVGATDLHIDKAHTALDIFHFAAFFNKYLTCIFENTQAFYATICKLLSIILLHCHKDHLDI